MFWETMYKDIIYSYVCRQAIYIYTVNCHSLRTGFKFTILNRRYIFNVMLVFPGVYPKNPGVFHERDETPIESYSKRTGLEPETSKIWR